MAETVATHEVQSENEMEEIIYRRENEIDININPPPSNDSLSGVGRPGLTGTPARDSNQEVTNTTEPNKDITVAPKHKGDKKRKRKTSVSSTISYREESPIPPLSPKNSRTCSSSNSSSGSDYSPSSATDTDDSSDSDDDTSHSSQSSSSSDSDTKYRKRKKTKKVKKHYKETTKSPNKCKKFKPTPAEGNLPKWKIPKHMAKYVNKHMNRYLPDRTAEESIMKSMPVPKNIYEAPILDEYISTPLEKREDVLTKDKELRKIQTNLRNVLGPLTNIWKQIEDINENKSGDIEGPALAKTLEQQVVLLGKTNNDISYLRRTNILNNFTKDKRKTKSILKQKADSLKKPSKHLFGKKFKKIIREKAKAKKESTDIFNALGPNRSPAPRKPFTQSPSSSDRGRGQRINVTTNTKGFNSTREGPGKKTTLSRKPEHTRPSITRNESNTGVTIDKSEPGRTRNNQHRNSKSTPSGKTKILSGKLEKVDKRCLYPANSDRTKNRLLGNTIPKRKSKRTKNVIRPNQTNGNGSTKYAQERGHRPFHTPTRSICKQYVPKKQKGRIPKTHHKLEETKSLHTIHPLQNGDHITPQGFTTAKRPITEDRSERCLLQHSPPPLLKEVHKISMGRKLIRIHMPMLWTSSRTKDLHKTHEGTNHSISQTQHSNDSLPRRHVDSSKKHGRSQVKPAHNNFPITTPRVHNKPKKVDNDTGHKNRIPRDDCKLRGNDPLPPTRKNERHTNAMSTNLRKTKHNPKNSDKTNRETNSHISSNPPSPYKVQTPPTMSNKGNETTPFNGNHHTTRHSSPNRAEMVDQQHNTIQWETNKNTKPRADNHIRCSDKRRVGCTLPRTVDRGEMDLRGKKPTHQHPRTKSSLPCNPNIYKTKERDIDSLEDRQPNSLKLPGKNGRHKEHDSHKTSTGNMGLPDNQGNITNSGTRPRIPKHTSRLGIKEPEGLIRMETRPKNLSVPLPNMGNTPHRPVRITHIVPTENILCMETGPTQQSDRCNATGLETPLCICFPPFLHDRQSTAESADTGYTHDTDNATMAITKLVPFSTSNVNRTPNTTSTTTKTPNLSRRIPTPHAPEWQPKTNSMENLRKPNDPEGISRTASTLITAARKQGTIRNYTSAWNKWTSWCNKWEVNTTECPINYVLDFLGELFEKGLAYNTINTYRSTISAYHIGHQNSPIGEAKEVCKLMKGVSNIRPPLPKYTTIWDVEDVLKMLESLYPNEGLSAKLLTLKLTMMLALCAIQRGSEIKYLDTTLMGRGEDICVFSFDKTAKHTRQGKRTKDLTIHGFPENRKICPITTLDAYINMTQTWRRENKTQLLLSHIKPHDPVTKSTIARWIKNVLKLSGINTDHFQAHSVRSASSSKANAGGLSINDILTRGNWSHKSTWQKYYNKPIHSSSLAYQHSVLKPNKKL